VDELEELKLQINSKEFDSLPAEEQFVSLNQLTKLLINENPREAIRYGKVTLQLTTKMDNPMLQVTALLNLSHAYFILSQTATAIQYAFDALKICEEQKDRQREAKISNNIASIYTIMEDCEKSLHYNQKALQIHQELGNEIGIATSYINMSWCYESNKDLDTAKTCCEKGLTICLKNNDFDKASYAYANLGHLCILQKKYDEAKTYFDLSLQHRKETKNYMDIANTIERLGYLDHLQGNETQAINHLEEALQLAKEKNFLEVEANVYSDYFDLYALRKDFETALSYHTKMYKIKEQLWKESNLKQIESLHYFDTLDRKEKELTLAKETAEEKESKLQGILDNMQDAFFQADLSGHFTYVNPTAATMYGYSSWQELIGLPATQLYAVESDRVKLIEQLKQSGKVKDWIVQGRRKDGSIFWVSMNVQFIQDINGNIIGTQGVCRDITERKLAEEEIKNLSETLEQKVHQRTRELEHSNQALEAFSHSVSHDLRAPLRAINGFSQILVKDYLDHMESEAKRLIQVVVDNTNRMDEIINGLLSISKISSIELKKRPIEMTEMVESIYRESTSPSDKKRITINISKLLTGFGDSALIRQVWVNLIENAVKFSRKKENPTIQISSYNEKDQTIYVIKDNGAGFNQDYQDKLFTIFQRLHSPTEFEGTGVGLALIHRVIQKHGGKVWAEGEEGVGATFYFSLPGG
jgi:PAS domain S-box-containing protein